jgi:hypothetical protein
MSNQDRDLGDSEIALHEAGHAVLHVMLGLGCERVTIVADADCAGASFHGGEYGRPAAFLGDEDDDVAELRRLAEDSFWLRHAIAAYAGAEALRRSGISNYDVGAEQDRSDAVDAINNITADAESIDALFALAKRRCIVLVEHYWPEIERVARALIESRSLTGEQAGQIVRQSVSDRRATLMTW